MKKLTLMTTALIGALAMAGCRNHPHPVGSPPAQVPSINKTLSFKKDMVRLYSTVGGSQKAGKVRVCIRNAASGRNKGLHYKRAGGPKYVVKKKNQSSCGHYSPGKKTFYLWKNNAFGKMKLRKTLNLNLSRFAGQQITFDWIRD